MFILIKNSYHCLFIHFLSLSTFCNILLAYISCIDNSQTVLLSYLPVLYVHRVYDLEVTIIMQPFTIFCWNDCGLSWAALTACQPAGMSVAVRGVEAGRLRGGDHPP